VNEAAERIFWYVVRYKLEHDGCSPSFEEIAGAVGGVSSTSAVSYNLDKLEEAGRLRMASGRNRSIQVVGGRWVYREDGNGDVPNHD
jgi:SOS-response transcriptional repressor LexA